jgi:hypothetical protein
MSRDTPPDYLFDVISGKLQPLPPEGIRGPVTPDGKFVFVRGNGPSPELIPVDGGLPIREMKGLQDRDRLIQITSDGAEAFVANPNGLSAAIYRVRLDSGDRQLGQDAGNARSYGRVRLDPRTDDARWTVLCLRHAATAF